MAAVVGGDGVVGAMVTYGLGTYAVLLASFLAVALPFALVESLPPLRAKCRRFKIQPDVHVSEPHKRLAVRMVTTNFVWLLPATVLAGPIIKSMLLPPHTTAMPWWRVPALLVIFFLIDDVWFYVYHRTLHAIPYLYQSFHKPHHVFTAPFAATSHATHPVEMMLQGVGGMLGPVLIGCTLSEFWLWLAVRQWQGMEDHTGYELWPLSFSLVPGVAGTRFHDWHHSHNNGNFASCFWFIDAAFGTAVATRC